MRAQRTPLRSPSQQAANRLNDTTLAYRRRRDDWHTAMRQAREAGMSYDHIAEIAGVSASTVKRMVG